MQKFYLGKVIKPQGVKGELKLKPNVNDNQMVKNITAVYFNDSNNPIKVKNIVYRLGYVYLMIEGLVDRNNAENYRNYKVYVDKDEISTKEDEFLIDDLEGLDVFDEENQFVGTVLSFENYGANDIVTILEGKREYSVAFLKCLAKLFLT